MLRNLFIAVALTIATAQVAFAGSSEEKKAGEAAVVLRELATIPEDGIPPKLLQQAYAIAVIPDVLKVGFIFGGRRGEGIMSVRTDSGRWSNPTFITLTGASVGFQIGASSTDLILVFKSRSSVEQITKGKITLGGDIAIAAGPLGRQASANTDIQFKAEAYSYSRSRGLFAGVSAEGASLQIDDTSNADFYNNPNIGPNEILSTTSRSKLPGAGKDFVRTLEHYSPAR